MDLMKALTSQYMKEELPQMNVGDTVRVHVKIKEGARERVQVFEGTIIARKHGGIEESITVRRLSYGVGCEKVFPVHSPSIVKVETVRRGKVRPCEALLPPQPPRQGRQGQGEGLSLSAKTSSGSPEEVFCIVSGYADRYAAQQEYGLAAREYSGRGWFLMLAVWLIISSMLYSLRLSNGGSFPKPLTAREEREYLERTAQGDLEARNVLIERNLRLVAHIMKKYYTQTSDQEDLISIGTIGLIKGISTFDPKKGARLATYAARCVENAMHPPGRYFPLRSAKRDRCASSDPVF